MKRLFAIISIVLIMALLVSCGSETKSHRTGPTDHAAGPQQGNEESVPPAADPDNGSGEEKSPESSSVKETEVRPEIRKALEAYEAFFDGYIEFMEEYKKAEGLALASMIGKYADMIVKMEEYEKEMDKLAEADLNDAEMALYIEVTARVAEKMMKAAL